MPWINTLFTDLPVLALGTISGVVVALLLTVLAEGWAALDFRTKPDAIRRIVVLSFALALLGSVAGVAGGTSREGVVGEIIPASLALAGGVSLYLFGVDQSRGLVASVCAVAFALALGIGYAGGAGTRGRADVERDFVAFCRDRLGNADLLGNDAAYCRFEATFGEICTHYLAKEMAAEGTVENGTYTNEAHYQDIYRALIFNLNRSSALKTHPACSFMLFNRDSQQSKGRLLTLPLPPEYFKTTP